MASQLARYHHAPLWGKTKFMDIQHKYTKLTTIQNILDGVEELLQGRLWIGRNVGYYAKAIAGIPIGNGVDVKCEAVHPLKKIGMLTNGLYMQNQLYLDQDDEKRRTLFDELAWKPSKRYVRKWFARFVMSVIDGEKESDGQGAAYEPVVGKWKKLFPWFEITFFAMDVVPIPMNSAPPIAQPNRKPIFAATVDVLLWKWKLSLG